MAKIQRIAKKVSKMNASELSSYGSKGISECKAALQESIKRGNDRLVEDLMQCGDMFGFQPDAQMLKMLLAYIPTSQNSEVLAERLLKFPKEVLETGGPALKGSLTLSPKIIARALLSPSTPDKITSELIDGYELVTAPYLGSEFNTKNVRPEQHNPILREIILAMKSGARWDNETSSIRLTTRLLSDYQDKFMTEVAGSNIGIDMASILDEAVQKIPNEKLRENFTTNNYPTASTCRKLFQNKDWKVEDIQDAILNGRTDKADDKILTKLWWGLTQKLLRESPRELEKMLSEKAGFDTMNVFFNKIPEAKKIGAELFAMGLNTVIDNDEALSNDVVSEFETLFLKDPETRRIILERVPTEKHNLILLAPEQRANIEEFYRSKSQAKEDQENIEDENEAVENLDEREEGEDDDFDILEFAQTKGWYKKASDEDAKDNIAQQLYRDKYGEPEKYEAGNASYTVPEPPQRPELRVKPTWYTMQNALGENVRIVNKIIAIGYKNGVDEIASAAATNPYLSRGLINRIIRFGFFENSVGSNAYKLAFHALQNPKGPSARVVGEILERGENDKLSQSAANLSKSPIDTALWYLSVGETPKGFDLLGERVVFNKSNSQRTWNKIQELLKSSRISEEEVINGLVFSDFCPAATIYHALPELKDEMLSILLEAMKKYPEKFEGSYNPVSQFFSWENLWGNEESDEQDGITSQKWLNEIIKDPSVAETFANSAGTKALSQIKMTPQQDAILRKPKTSDTDEVVDKNIEEDEEDNEFEDMLLYGKKSAGWYKTSKILDGIEKEAALFDRATLLSAILMVLTGIDVTLAAEKSNVPENVINQAIQNPALVQEAKELASGKTKTVDEIIADSPAIQENIIARTIFREGTAEDWKGKVAIAATIWNRGDGNLLKMAQEIRRPKAFSCWNRASDEDWINGTEYSGKAWEESKKIARALATGKFTPPHPYTHYYNPKRVKEMPNWAFHSDKKQRHLPYEQIGSHRFLHGR